jgi:hypothetical protein
VKRDAIISDDQRYRYALTRDWSDELDGHRGRGDVCWIMLNPSTADAEIDDPTIRRCIRFSQAWAFSSMTVVNLYAYRAPKPTELMACTGLEIVGLHNFRVTHEAMRQANRIVAAWGKPPRKRLEAGALGIQARANELGVALWCLGVTKDGHPRHPGPLGMLPLDTVPQIWRDYRPDSERLSPRHAGG